MIERRERKNTQQNLERVLQAAHELFAERGSDVTMEQVAQRAGVGVGTIYRRFPSKEALYRAVRQTACSHTQHYISVAVETANDPVCKIQALVLVQCQRSETQSVLLEFEATSYEPASTVLSRSQEPELYWTLHQLLKQIIIEGQTQGRFRQGDADALASMCLELLTPHSFQRVRKATGGCAQDIAEHVAMFLLNGLYKS